MSFTVWMPLLFLVSSPAEDSPEGFMRQLAGSDARFWVDHQAEALVPRDTILFFFQGLTSLEVAPGGMVGPEDIQGGYRVRFPVSRWRYRRSGRIHSVTDTSVVQWTAHDGYRWVQVPLFQRKAPGLDPRQGICGGVILTMVILVVAVLILGYVRRRYRE